MWLSEEQLRDLTGKKQRAAQIRILDTASPMPIPYRIVNGRVIVCLSDLEQQSSREPRLRLDRDSPKRSKVRKI